MMRFSNLKRGWCAGGCDAASKGHCGWVHQSNADAVEGLQWQSQPRILDEVETGKTDQVGKVDNSQTSLKAKLLVKRAAEEHDNHLNDIDKNKNMSLKRL